MYYYKIGYFKWLHWYHSSKTTRWHSKNFTFSC